MGTNSVTAPRLRDLLLFERRELGRSRLRPLLRDLNFVA
jgi:hypothetical protein